MEAKTPVSTAASLLVDSAAAQLTVISGPQKGSRFNLWPKPGGMIVGRSHDCDLRLEDKNTSRHHCRLHCDDAGVLLEDLDSRYGVEINGERLRGARRLRHGDEVRIGLVRLVLSIASQSTARGRRLPPPGDPVEAPAAPPQAGTVPALAFGPRVDTLTPTPVTAQLSHASALAYFSRPPAAATPRAPADPQPVESAAPDGADPAAFSLGATAGPDEATVLDPRGALALRASPPAGAPAAEAPVERSVTEVPARPRSVTVPLWAVLLGGALLLAVMALLALGLRPGR